MRFLINSDGNGWWNALKIAQMNVGADIEKLIVVSDLHGTLPALSALDQILGDMTEKVQVIADGDYVINGPHPVEVIDWVRTNAGEFAVLGNHDEWVLKAEEGEFPPYTEDGAFNRMDAGLREYLAGLPHMLELTWNGSRIRITHDKATDGVSFSWQGRVSEVFDAVADPSVDLTVTAHTHYPFVREKDGSTVANAGSAAALLLGHKREDGSMAPKGDDEYEPLAEIYSTYLSIVLENGKPKATVEKFNYDVEEAVRLIKESGHPQFTRLAEIYRTGVCW